MTIVPFAPMRGLNVRAFFIGGIDPLGSILVTGDDERVDDSIIVQDTDFQVSFSWRY